MPSDAYTCRHHHPSYEAFKTGFFSRLRSFKSRSSKASLSSFETRLPTEKLNGNPEPYKRFNSPRYPGMAGLPQGKTVTFVPGGKREDVERYDERESG